MNAELLHKVKTEGDALRKERDKMSARRKQIVDQLEAHDQEWNYLQAKIQALESYEKAEAGKAEADLPVVSLRGKLPDAPKPEVKK